MKKTIARLFILLAFISAPSFAGDIYLVCESANGENFQSASFRRSTNSEENIDAIFARLVVEKNGKKATVISLKMKEIYTTAIITTIDEEIIDIKRANLSPLGDAIQVIDDIECRIQD